MRTYDRSQKNARAVAPTHTIALTSLYNARAYGPVEAGGTLRAVTHAARGPSASPNACDMPKVCGLNREVYAGEKRVETTCR